MIIFQRKKSTSTDKSKSVLCHISSKFLNKDMLVRLDQPVNPKERV